MRIDNIKTKNGTKMNLGKITVLVGANNVGKSQTLKDIKNKMEKGFSPKSIMLEEINFQTAKCFDDILKGLEIKDSENSIGVKVIEGITNNLSSTERFEFRYDRLERQYNSDKNMDIFMGNISKFRVSHLDAASRLKLVDTTQSFNPSEHTPMNVMQALFIQKSNEDTLRNAFREAFNMDIMLDYSGLKDFCLRVATEFPNIPPDPREAYPILRKFNKIDDQGDGFRSFVGIILSILFSKDRIILLDEPEAFLHPAQARYLGKWIADNSTNFKGQLIIATHNANFLNGIVTSENSIDIYRLNRVGNETSYHLIPSNATSKLSKSPMLSSQRVLESIFHRGVIVCEADADRTIYQTIARIELNNQEMLFIHSHNKQTLKDVARLLREASIPVSVVADIDLLNDKADFCSLIETLSEENVDNSLISLREKISKSVNESSDEEILNCLKQNINELKLQLENGDHGFDGARGALNRIRREVTKWKKPKSHGIEGFPSEIQTDVTKIIEKLKSYGLYLVPVGELEGWIELGTTKKNRWIVKALDEIYKRKSPNNLIDFVRELVE